MTPVIRQMTRSELDTALGWAEAEGWNPGLSDAEAFFAADPEGFLVAELAGQVMASLSIVRFGADTAFLGLYICHPGARGQGIGFQLWQEGMARLAPRSTGLDGVVAQQANYARSGFALSHRNLRYTGALMPQGPDRTEAFTDAHLRAALALDRAVTGFDRTRLLGKWLNGDATRQTRVLLQDGEIAALGTLRTCAVGHKIGPLFAQDRPAAEAMLDALAARATSGEVSLDVPEPNAAARAVAEARGMTPAFETARMWRGPAPAQDLARTFGVTTFELG